MKTKLVPEVHASEKIGQWSESKKEVSVVAVHDICVVFSLLSTHDGLVMQVLVWLCMVWFGASYINLR